MDSNVPSDQQVRASAITLAITANLKLDADGLMALAQRMADFMLGASAAAKPVKSPKAPAATTAASSVPPAASPAIPPSAALASLVPTPTVAPPAAQPTAAATATAPSTIAPPTTVTAVAESLRACVQDKAPGRGRDVAVAILAQFGVTTLAQVPPTKLAEFKAALDNAGKGASAPAADPTGGLLA